MKRHGEQIVPVTFNPYLKKQREDHGHGAAAATWNRSFPPDHGLATTAAALPNTNTVCNTIATVPLPTVAHSPRSDAPKPAALPKGDAPIAHHSTSAVNNKGTPKDQHYTSSWIPQSKLITFRSAEILTVLEVADLLQQQDSIGRDVRVTGIWFQQVLASDDDPPGTTTTTRHWLQDPLADFSSSTTEECKRIPIRNLEESFAHPRVYGHDDDSTLVTVFGRIADGSVVEARLAVVVQGIHMGLYTKAVLARRAALEGRKQSSECTEESTTSSHMSST